MSLTSRQLRHLRSLAHHLNPVVQVGSAGVSEGVVRETDEALAAHELIKVRIDADRAARTEIGAALAEQTRSEIAQSIGRVVVLYRPARVREDRKISLPG